MQRFLPKGTKIEFVQWVDRASKTHKGEPPGYALRGTRSGTQKNELSYVKNIRVKYTTPDGKTGHFTVNRPFPGKGPARDRLDKTASKLQGYVDHYVRSRAQTKR